MTARFDIEDIVAISVGIWVRNLPRFVALTMLLHLPVIAWEVAPLIDPLWNLLRYYYDFVPLPVSRSLPSGDLAAQACMVAVVAHHALVALNGNSGPIGRGLGTAVHRFFPAIGVALVGWVATLGASTVVDWFVWNPWTGEWMLLGVILRYVVVPALFYLAVPVAVVERRGPIGSIVRGIALARQGWIRVLALVLGWQSLLWGGDWLLARIVLPGGPELTSDDRAALVAYGLISLGLHLALSSLEAVLAVVTYGSLREEKAGLATEKLVQVFE